jgi:hypothetical protein
MRLYAVRFLCVSRHVYAFDLGGPRIELHNRIEISMRFMCYLCAVYPVLCTAYAVI